MQNGCRIHHHKIFQRNKSFSTGSIYPSDQKKTSGLIFIQLSNLGIISNHFLVGAQPPIYCSFARHLVGKMEIFVALLLSCSLLSTTQLKKTHKTNCCFSTQTWTKPNGPNTFWERNALINKANTASFFWNPPSYCWWKKSKQPRRMVLKPCK